jgi:hypothetical protein
VCESGAVIGDGSDGGELFRGEIPGGATGTYVCRKDILFYRVCPYGCGYTKLNTAFKKSTHVGVGEKKGIISLIRGKARIPIDKYYINDETG